MPRIYTSESDPLDFCRRHFPTEGSATQKYGGLGDGPDGRGNCFGYDAEHPSYDAERGGDCEYRCHVCKRPLGEADE